MKNKTVLKKLNDLADELMILGEATFEDKILREHLRNSRRELYVAIGAIKEQIKNEEEEA